MTREEAINIICGIQADNLNLNDAYIKDKYEALDMAIKALEQEPCDDAISRQAVLKQTYDWSKDEFLRDTTPFDYLRKRINDIPPVNPQEPKTGHWIDFERPISKGEWISGAKCDACGYEIGWMFACEWNYCPNCGARMAESEDKDASSN